MGLGRGGQARTMLLITPPGVYPAQGDTRLLTDALEREALDGRRVLDLCTGSGAVAMAAAALGARVTAVDVSRRALAAAAANLLLNRRRVRLRHGDLLAPVAGSRFDLITANPPYVPSRSAPPRRGIARSWDAGGDGRALLDRICADAPALLAPGGVLLVVQSALAGVPATCAALARAGLRVGIAARLRQPFGPVMTARAGWFEERGLIPPGQREEELVVVRGVRPV
ncbi:HemK2/MTQ2 family protein methyltransferase [Kitasatospora sp. NPDC093679]|uniref:HemK2/MTQ2 family protein methyltransferase n=1 Tax=Kitasatospora sp. NPDC093679 TaxID=3154983 RepID=UPI00343D9878